MGPGTKDEMLGLSNHIVLLKTMSLRGSLFSDFSRKPGARLSDSHPDPVSY